MVMTPRDRLAFVREWIRANFVGAQPSERQALLDSITVGIDEIDRLSTAERPETAAFLPSMGNEAWLTNPND